MCDPDSIDSGSSPCHFCAQAAELVTLTEACRCAKGLSVTIYTDSRYVFGVVHDFGALWKHRGFLKSDGSPILNHKLVAELLEAILLPSSVAVCKCTAHAHSSDPVSVGNARADATAKEAATHAPAYFFLSSADGSHLPALTLSVLQSLTSKRDVKLWSSVGARKSPEGWFGPDGKPCLPSALFSPLC